MKGYEVECKRMQQKHARPRWRVGSRVQLRDGTVAVITRAVVRDWGVEYDLDNGAMVLQHHVMGRAP